MFGKKQEYTKELEDRLDSAKSQLEGLQGRLKQLENSSRQMPPFFESQIIAQSDMDKELAKVESRAQDAMDASSECGLAYEQFAIEFTSMRGQLEEEEKKKKELLSVLGRERKNLDAYAQEKGYLQSPAQALQQAQVQMAENIRRVYEVLGQMQDFSKQMSTLSLNCAIEAGRLGAGGRKFIDAAEDVRKLSSSYESAAKEVGSQMDEVRVQFEQMGKQVRELTEALKKDGQSVAHLSKIHAEAEDLCAQAAGQAYSEKALALTAILKKISQNHETIASLQRQSLSAIQLINASLRDEQEARKEMERIFDSMGEHLKHS